MRTETHTVRIGEKMGPIDWAYDFRTHFDNYCTSDKGRDEICAKRVAKLRLIDEAVKAGRTVYASNYGGYPRIWARVLDVGMYDGWPYWKPVPSVMLASPLGGGEWSYFSMLTEAEERES